MRHVSPAEVPAAGRGQHESYWIGGRIFHVCSGAGPGVRATVWLIDAGRAGGIDIAGLVVVNLEGPAAADSSHPSRVVGLVDERATPQQMWAVAEMFRADVSCGLTCFTGGTRVQRTYQVPIAYGSTDGLWTCSVPGRLRVALPVPGPVWARTPRWTGRAAELSVAMPEEDWDFGFEDCDASHAWFVTRSPVGRPDDWREEP